MGILTTLFKKDLIAIPLGLVGTITLELYGLDIAMLGFAFMVGLILIDTLLGVYIAHTHKIVSSRIGSDGLFKKFTWILMSGLCIFIMGNMGATTDSQALHVMLSMGLMGVIAYRIIFEIISLVENLAVISTRSEQQTLQWISKTLLRIVGIGQEQIDKKIDKYTLNKDLQEAQSYEQ